MTVGNLPYRFLNGLLRIFFKFLYHEFSWGYDLVADLVSAGQWKSWILSILPDLRGPKVLELGHGPGHLMSAMVASSMKPVGLDESWQMGCLAFNRMVGIGGGFLLVNGYAQFLPFPNDSFNTIVSTFPSEYILDARTLSEAYRVLIPDGIMVILPTAWITGSSLHERLLAWLFHITGQAPEWDERHIAPLIKAGFRVRVERRNLRSSQLLIIHAEK